jgi:predicted phage baseplate assembly protein
MVVPEDTMIVAAYHTTRAEAGNLAAGRVDTLAESVHNRALLSEYDTGSHRYSFEVVRALLSEITNPVPATGGAAAETLAHAEGRATELLARATRAVTLADYERLAMETPGVRLARVAARANLHPGFPCVKATGVITVIVLPHLPRGRPMPSAGLLRAVAAYLNRRRLIGTRLEITGPTYTEVSVRTRVRAHRLASRADLRRRIVQALNDFFNPLTGGPERNGWPFGHDVYRSEILQLLDDVPGVEHVLELELRAAGCAQCGNVCLGPLGLTAAGQHEIEVV